MAKDPAVLFYTSDFLSGVSDLTMEERGQYITLLCLQHQKGPLSDKAIKINVGEISKDVKSKFLRDEAGNSYNPRMFEESDKRKKHSKKQSENAMKRWNKEKEKDTKLDTTAYPMASATAMPLENENEDENINEVKDINDNEIKTLDNFTTRTQVMNLVNELAKKKELSGYGREVLEVIRYIPKNDFDNDLPAVRKLVQDSLNQNKVTVKEHDQLTNYINGDGESVPMAG